MVVDHATDSENAALKGGMDATNETLDQVSDEGLSTLERAEGQLLER